MDKYEYLFILGVDKWADSSCMKEKTTNIHYPQFSSLAQQLYINCVKLQIKVMYWYSCYIMNTLYCAYKCFWKLWNALCIIIKKKLFKN